MTTGKDEIICSKSRADADYAVRKGLAMDKKRKKVITENAVSKLCSLPLGGYEQKVLIEGRTKKLPVVITLHGGPGSPVPFSVGCRGLFPELTDRFIMVYWDQLGCGINDHVIDDSFTIDSFVQMTKDLIQEVKGMFPHNKMYIFSVSWGSVLSAKILEADSHIVDGIVVWGQIVKDVFLGEEVLDALECSGLPGKKFEEIKAIRKEKITAKDLRLISISIRKYTSGYQNKKGNRAPVGNIVKGLLTSPDYKMKDFKAVMVNGYRKNLSLWKEILSLDLSQLLGNVQIPYMILQGDTDIVASTERVIELVKNSDNENLTCELVKNSGHIPGNEGMDRIFEKLCELKEMQGGPV